MKKAIKFSFLIKLFILVTSFTPLFSQVTVDISCNGASGGACFYDLEPSSTTYTYYPVVNGLNGATITAYLWTVTGGSLVGNNTSQNCNVVWNNTPNSGATSKKIKVKITYTGNNTKESNEQTIGSGISVLSAM